VLVDEALGHLSNISVKRGESCIAPERRDGAGLDVKTLADNQPTVTNMPSLLPKQGDDALAHLGRRRA